MLETPELRNTMVFSPKALPDCDFNQEVLLVTTIISPPSGPLRGFLLLFCIEDYFVIEFPVCGGEIGPLSMYADLGHCHCLGSFL